MCLQPVLVSSELAAKQCTKSERRRRASDEAKDLKMRKRDRIVGDESWQIA